MKLEVKEIPQPKREFVLTLTEEEARALNSVLGKVGGDPDGPRGAVGPIYNALDEAGVPDDIHGQLFIGRLTGADKWP